MRSSHADQDEKGRRHRTARPPATSGTASRSSNTPLPRWWLYIFYACIAFAIVYWVLYPVVAADLAATTHGLLGYSARAVIDADVQRCGRRSARRTSTTHRGDARSSESRKDPDLLDFAMTGGRAAFGDNCAPCHGPGGAGAQGLSRTSPTTSGCGAARSSDIQQTITFGVRTTIADTRQSQMPRFGADEILNAAADRRRRRLRRCPCRSSRQPAARRQARRKVFADNCAACHGDERQGQPGGRRAEPDRRRSGSMAATRRRIVDDRSPTRATAACRPGARGSTPTTIKMLAVYVHSPRRRSVRRRWMATMDGPAPSRQARAPMTAVPLFAPHENASIRAAVTGHASRRMKWAVLIALPRILLHRSLAALGPRAGAPDQALLIDMPRAARLFLLHRDLAAGSLLPRRAADHRRRRRCSSSPACSAASGAATPARRRSGPTSSSGPSG